LTTEKHWTIEPDLRSDAVRLSDGRHHVGIIPGLPKHVIAQYDALDPVEANAYMEGFWAGLEYCDRVVCEYDGLPLENDLEHNFIRDE